MEKVTLACGMTPGSRWVGTWCMLNAYYTAVHVLTFGNPFGFCHLSYFIDFFFHKSGFLKSVQGKSHRMFVVDFVPHPELVRNGGLIW